VSHSGVKARLADAAAGPAVTDGHQISYERQEPIRPSLGLTLIAGVEIALTTGDGGCAMAVPAGSLNYVRPTPTIFELEALEGLPCGCVAAAFRARPWDVAVVSLEAKGPHCILAGHTSGQVLRLGDPSEFDEDEDDE
jgi:hypothetical protein